MSDTIRISKCKWRECKLGEVITSNNKSISTEYLFKEILYLETGSITQGKIEGFQKHILANAPSRARRLVRQHDIVYSTVRPIQKHYGFITNPPENLVVSTGFSVIETKTKYADPKFIYYYLISDEVVEFLDMIAEGSTSAYPSIKPFDIENLDIDLPPLSEQKAIASILSSLDDKIVLLHRQNKTLEAMAKTLFSHWFVEKANDDWKNFKVSSFVHHLKINISPSTKPSSEYFHYSLPSFDNGRKPSVEFGRDILSNKYKVVADSILVSKLNPQFPRVWAINKNLKDNSICSTEFQVIKPIDDRLYAFIFFLFNSDEAKNALIMAASGTSGSHQRVTPEDILNIAIALPNIELAYKFSEITNSYLKKINLNIQQIGTIERLRDTLLPKLMSGEVRVKS